MKRIFLSALIGIGMVAAIFQVSSESEAARTPVDYPLVCRGGGTLVTGPAPGEGNLGFVFTRGTRPADEGLDPGQCSWKDRAIQAAEPDRVSQHVEEVVGAPKPLWYVELRDPDKYWTFMVSNNGKGQLIATSARPGGIDVSPTKTTGFTPSANGVESFETYQLFDDKCFLVLPPVAEAAPGTNLVGYINHWNESGCMTQYNVSFRGTVWFDLNEIFNKRSPKVTYAMLTFKKILAVANDENGKPITRTCHDVLQVASEDWMKDHPYSSLPYISGDHFVAAGAFDFSAPINSCPPEGCNIAVTDVVNGWILHPELRYGFVMTGENENFLAKLIPKTNDACETRYGDFSLTVTYKYSEPPIIIIPPGTPVRKNVALTSNGGTASASSTSAPFSPAKAIDGEYKGLNWLSGGGWQGAGPTDDDWLQVNFSGYKTIDQIDVFMIQDNYTSPIEPALDTPSTKYGLTNFRVQYWTQFGAWADVVVPGNPVTGNMNVWKQFKFRGLRTNKIRVLVSKTPDGWSRIAELEAWGY